MPSCLFPVKKIELNDDLVVTSVPADYPSHLITLGFQSGALMFFNPLKSKLLKIIPCAHDMSVSTLSILPDGSVLSGSCDGVFKQWAHGLCINTLVFDKLHFSYIYRVLSSPNTIFVLYRSSKNSDIKIAYLNLTDKIWKTVDGFKNIDLISQLKNATTLTKPNKKLIFNTCGETMGQVKLFNTESGSLEIFDLPSKWPTSSTHSYFNAPSIHYAFNTYSNQEIVAVGNSIGQLSLLDTEQNQWKTLSDSIDISYELRQLSFFSNDVLISHSKFSLMSPLPMGKAKTLIQFWDLNTNKCIHTLEPSVPIKYLRVLPNEMLLTISHKNNMQFWDVSHLKLECQKTAPFSQNHGHI